MLEKILRAPLRGEIIALLERIDSIDDRNDSSYWRAVGLINSQASRFTYYERMLLRNALAKIARRETLQAAMDVVINTPLTDDAVLTQSAVPERKPSAVNLIKETIYGWADDHEIKRRIARETLTAELDILRFSAARAEAEAELARAGADKARVETQTYIQQHTPMMTVRKSPTGKTLMQR